MKQVGLPVSDASGIVLQGEWTGSPLELTRAQWTAICAARLIELRPSSEPQMLRATAADMALTLHYFDPALAAELEHEGGMLDD